MTLNNSTDSDSNVKLSASDDAARGSSDCSVVFPVPDIQIITYPAPLPQFSPTIEGVLASGSKSQVMNIYNEIVKEAKTFYTPMMPTDTFKAKASYANVGKTVIEKYPVLSVSDGRPGSPTPWSFFTGKLSSYMRNGRCRLKHKLYERQPAAKVAKTVGLCHVPPLPNLVNMSGDEYEKHVDEIKRL